MRSKEMGIIGGAVLVVMAAWAGVAPLGASQAPAAAKANPVEHAISGTVESLDSAAKTVAIKTADGSVKVFKVTEKSVVEGAKACASYTALGAEKGSHVVVKYTGEASDATVSGVKVIGKGTVKVSEGTVTKVDDAAKTVTVKTASGAEEVYQFSEKVTVDSAKGIAKGAEKAPRCLSITPTKPARKSPTSSSTSSSSTTSRSSTSSGLRFQDAADFSRRGFLKPRSVVRGRAGAAFSDAGLPATRASGPPGGGVTSPAAQTAPASTDPGPSHRRPNNRTRLHPPSSVPDWLSIGRDRRR